MAPLDFAAFNTNMVFMELYTKKLDTYKFELPDLLNRIFNRVHITEQCLVAMVSPIQSPFQAYTHGEYVKRIKELAWEANTDILDIKANHRNDTPYREYLKEIQNFKTSLHNATRELCNLQQTMCMESIPHQAPS